MISSFQLLLMVHIQFFLISNKSLFSFRMTNDWQREKTIRREEYDEKIKKSCDDFD